MVTCEKNCVPPRFRVGARVRVRRGVADPDYPDLPLGGWEGAIREVAPGSPSVYLVRWTCDTLQTVDPVYRQRCEFDDVDFHTMWLDEGDLELGHGGPPAVEPPLPAASPD